MNKIIASKLPSDSIAAPYQAQGGYVDCFSIEVQGSPSFSRYLEAFYTSRVFKVERLILGLLLGKPSTDQQASQLSIGEIDQFAAWNQEPRTDSQIVMCDYQELTRSWLMARNNLGSTTLYFGTIIALKGRAREVKDNREPMPKLVLGAHLLYSRILLRSAAARLARIGDI